MFGEATGEATASFAAVADGSVVAVVVIALGALTGSSTFGAVEEVKDASSLAGTAGAISEVGLETSFLLKKLPKIEPLLFAFGAVSRLVVPAADSTAEGCAVSPVTTVGFSVVPVVVPVVVGAISPSVARGTDYTCS